MKINFNSTSSFFATLRDTVTFIQYQNQALYKLHKLPENEKGTLLTIQIVGKNIFFKKSATELMRDDILMSFSKADIALITHIATKKEVEQETKPKALMRVVRQLFGGNSGKTKFLLKSSEQDQLIEAHPEEMLTNKEALTMLSSEDAAKVGFAAAENRFIDIKKAISPAFTCQIICQDFIEQHITYLDAERDTKHTLSINELFHNKGLLALFNKLDQQMISFAAGEAYQKRINMKQEYRFKLCTYLGEVIEYQDVDGNIAKESLIDLAFDEDLLVEFSQEDRDIIHFAAGEISKEKELALKVQ